MTLKLRLYPTLYASRKEFSYTRDALYASVGFDEGKTREANQEIVENDGTRTMYRACSSDADIYRFRGMEFNEVYVSPACSPDVHSGALRLHVIPSRQP